MKEITKKDVDWTRKNYPIILFASSLIAILDLIISTPFYGFPVPAMWFVFWTIGLVISLMALVIWLLSEANT